MSNEQFKKYIAAVALMQEFGKLSAHEAFELQMYAGILRFLDDVGGVEVMQRQLSCLLDNCTESIRTKKGRKTRIAEQCIRDLEISGVSQ